MSIGPAAAQITAEAVKSVLPDHLCLEPLYINLLKVDLLSGVFLTNSGQLRCLQLIALHAESSLNMTVSKVWIGRAESPLLN